jgi:hypothetical protein
VILVNDAIHPIHSKGSQTSRKPLPQDGEHSSAGNA